MANIQFIDVIREYRRASIVTEAFSKKQLAQAVAAVKSVLERQLGTVLYSNDRPEQFVCRYGTFFGVRFFVGTTTQAIRFNFEITGSSSEIASVDVWDQTEGKFPVANIPTKGISVVKIIPLIITVLRDPKGSIGKPVSDSSRLNESVNVNGQQFDTKAEAIITLLRQGHTPKEIADLTGANVSQIYGLKRKASQPQTSQSDTGPKIRAGSEEQTVDPDIAEANKQFSRVKYADPETVFDDLQDLIDLVISGAQPSLLVTGMSGIGKTSTVVSRISQFKPSDQIKIVKGFATPFGLYQTLFENRTRLIVFDDCDSIFRDPNARNILKAALDSYDQRTVSWPSRNTFDTDGMTPEEIDAKVEESDKLPNEFDFEGQIIFISNLRSDQIEPAIRSRSMAIDITLKAQDVFLRMESILDKLAPGIRREFKQDALEHLKSNHDKLGKEANIRTLINAAKIRAGGSPNWKRLVERYS